MYPSQPKNLEPDVLVRLSREYRKINTALEYSKLSSKCVYGARKLYVLKNIENFCPTCGLPQRCTGVWVGLQYPVLSERGCY